MSNTQNKLKSHQTSISQALAAAEALKLRIAELEAQHLEMEAEYRQETISANDNSPISSMQAARLLIQHVPELAGNKPESIQTKLSLLRKVGVLLDTPAQVAQFIAKGEVVEIKAAALACADVRDHFGRNAKAAAQAAPTPITPPPASAAASPFVTRTLPSKTTISRSEAATILSKAVGSHASDRMAKMLRYLAENGGMAPNTDTFYFDKVVALADSF